MVTYYLIFNQTTYCQICSHNTINIPKNIHSLRSLRNQLIDYQIVNKVYLFARKKKKIRTVLFVCLFAGLLLFVCFVLFCFFFN